MNTDTPSYEEWQERQAEDRQEERSEAETPAPPFYVHRLPSLAERRPATLEECRRAVKATVAGRHMGEWYFPFYRGHEREDVQAWLEEERR